MSNPCNDKTGQDPSGHDGLAIDRIIVNRDTLYIVGGCFREGGGGGSSSGAAAACEWAGQSKLRQSGDIEACGRLNATLGRWDFYRLDAVSGQCGDERLDVSVQVNGARSLRQALLGSTVGTNLVQATSQTLSSECPNGIIKIKATPQNSVPQVTHRNPMFLTTPLASMPLAGW